jgi:hypothetical protein
MCIADSTPGSGVNILGQLAFVADRTDHGTLDAQKYSLSNPLFQAS